MGTDKRARQKELHRTRAEQARQQAEAAARRSKLIRLSIPIVLLVVVLGLFVYFSGNNDTTTSTKATTTTSSPANGASTTSAPAVPAAALKGPATGASIKGDTPCPKADGSSARTSTFEKAPPMCIDARKTYTAKFATSKGNFTITLDTNKAPKTVNNFVVLSRYHFYDGIDFHRIIADFMIQGGDPSNPPTGSGGPGYKFDDELPKQGEYAVGSIAMANSGANTNGSQFFIITGAQGTSLPPSYSLFGKVTEGLDVVSAIGKVPSVKTNSSDGAPTEAVTITGITITES